MGYRAKYAWSRPSNCASNLARDLGRATVARGEVQTLGLARCRAEGGRLLSPLRRSRTNAFPIDTDFKDLWKKRYGLNGWSNSQQAHFAFKHFGKHAGLAQQFLFSGERLVS